MGGMPKVSEAHLESRRRQILDAATSCFARQGFHATSMQDIFQSSGLSAGAVYRYFPSKTALIREIAEDALAATGGELDSAITEAAGDPASLSIPDVVTRVVARLGTSQLIAVRPVIMHIWAEAGRDPDLTVLAADLLGQLASRFERLLLLHAEAGRLPPGTDTAALARLILATIQGYLVQYGILGEPPDVAAASQAVFGGL
jgi:TetR/AcrR family transcriptional regulator, transcriptional repressor of aconitase